MAIMDVQAVAQRSQPLRAEVHWIGNARRELEVLHIPIEHLYFNIENGRYADRMIRLRHENPGVEIDPRVEKWKAKIEEMLAGEHKDTARDRAAFERLLEDIRNRTQLRPGVVTRDGGVLDGNRRLAALRRLSSENRDRFRNFDAVILPPETTPEDRWRIEAGLQLGLNERWDYSPINELLKIREGVRMYESMIQGGTIPDGDAVRLVAEAIYGRTEVQIREMIARLELIDEYLSFTGRPGSYDAIGPLSERFLEASRVIQAAENQNHDPAFLARLKAALFYVIDRGQMDNWELRKVYEALGGDPRKRGRKPKGANVEALTAFLSAFPDPRLLRANLRTAHAPTVSLAERKAATSVSEPREASQSGGEVVDNAKIGAATEKFIRTMESAALSKTPRKVAAGASAEIAALHAALQDRKTLTGMTLDDRAAVMEAVTSMQMQLAECRTRLTKT